MKVFLNQMVEYRRRILSKLKKIVKLFFEMSKIIKVIKQDSYFPELSRKSKTVRFFDNCLWLLETGEVNNFYNLYGFDVKGKDIKGYCNNLYFMNSRNISNNILKPESQIVLLRDKFLFYKYMKANDMEIPNLIGILSDGVLYSENLEEIRTENIKENKDYFIKELYGECASYVKHIEDYKEFNEEISHIEKGKYILQKKVYQSDEINKLNPEALNTLRIVTINKNGNIYVLSAVLRVGTKKSGKVDNWAKGGISIGVDKFGNLSKYGFLKPGYGGKVEEHPDTKLAFEGFKIPNYEEIIREVCKAHRLYYNIRSIGWDIAITNNGVVFIEGNDNWEMSLMQACNGGLKEAWNKSIVDLYNK